MPRPEDVSQGPESVAEYKRRLDEWRARHDSFERLRERVADSREEAALRVLLKDGKPRVTRDRMAKSDLLFPAGRTGLFLSTTALWKPFASVSAAMTKAMGGTFTKAITPEGMRRTNKDLMRADGVRDIVAMAVSNHLDDAMHAHYSTVSQTEMTQAVAQVIDLAAFRRAHEDASGVLQEGVNAGRPSSSL